MTSIDRNVTFKYFYLTSIDRNVAFKYLNDKHRQKCDI